MKLRVPVRGRAKLQYPEHEGWVFVCAAHPFPYAQKGSPTSAPTGPQERQPQTTSPQSEIRKAPAYRVPKILRKNLSP